MRNNHGKKIQFFSSRDAANEALMRSQPATIYDLAPINETLLNIGAGLHSVADLIQDFENRIGVLEMDAVQAQSIHPYGAYGLVCYACRKSPRWVKPVRRADGMYYMGCGITWECLLGCGQTPVRADGPGSKWQGEDLLVPASTIPKENADVTT